MSEKGLSLYIHWPFCTSKCPYCDFNSHVSASIDAHEWFNAYKQELQFFKQWLPERKIKTIFFGGGTPSLMPPWLVEDVLSEIAKLWPVGDVEITLEANPGSVELAKLQAFKSAGVNRLSMGVQSLRDESLRFLGRLHNREEAIKAIELVSNTFERYSFDLIYARPEQSLEDWREELSEALTYTHDHISAYQLIIEPGTAFYTKYQRGEFKLPDEDLSADMYDLTKDMLLEKGLLAYEVSNYAKPGSESQHNLVYWRYEDYVGIGPGAHGRIYDNGIKKAIKNVRAPKLWLEAVAEKEQGVQEIVNLNHGEIAQEIIIMGLRLAEGISLRNDYGIELFDYLKPEAISKFKEAGLLSIDNNWLKLNFEGRKILNYIVAELLVD